jgi:hypothetical protein
MRHTPALAQQLVALHQRDLTTQAAQSRLVAQTRSTSSSSSRKELPMSILIAVQSLVQGFLLSPRAASMAAGAVLGGR